MGEGIWLIHLLGYCVDSGYQSNESALHLCIGQILDALLLGNLKLLLAFHVALVGVTRGVFPHVCVFHNLFRAE